MTFALLRLHNLSDCVSAHAKQFVMGRLAIGRFSSNRRITHLYVTLSIMLCYIMLCYLYVTLTDLLGL